MERFIVKKPFTYLGKEFKRGDYFDPDKYDMPAIKIKTRVQANMIADMRTLTEKQIRELTGSRVSAPAVEKAPEAPKQDNSFSVDGQKGNRRNKNA